MIGKNHEIEEIEPERCGLFIFIFLHFVCEGETCYTNSEQFHMQ
jgi:hypothetical protein